MPRPTKTTADDPPAAPKRPSTGGLFAPRRNGGHSAVTHERIAEDLEAFRKAGGKIEVLGTTRALKKIDPDDEASPPRPASPSPSRPRR